MYPLVSGNGQRTAAWGDTREKMLAGYRGVAACRVHGRGCWGAWGALSESGGEPRPAEESTGMAASLGRVRFRIRVGALGLGRIRVRCGQGGEGGGRILRCIAANSWCKSWSTRAVLRARTVLRARCRLQALIDRARFTGSHPH